MSRAGNWPPGLRWIIRRVKPSRRHLKNLTAYERETGWKYSIICTNIPEEGLEGVPGSRHAQFIDVLHRQHAVVEDGVRTGKAAGLRNLPSKSWRVNCGWTVTANIAADLQAWCRLLGPLPLTSGTYVRLREIRRRDRYGVGDLFGVPVPPLEWCSAGGPGGPVPVGRVCEDLADEQGDGVASAGGALAAVRAAGISGDVTADQGQYGGEGDQARVGPGLPGGAGGDRRGHVADQQQRPGFLPGQGDRASAQGAAGALDGLLQVQERYFYLYVGSRWCLMRRSIM
jgi:hypothetical protein